MNLRKKTHQTINQKVEARKPLLKAQLKEDKAAKENLKANKTVKTLTTKTWTRTTTKRITMAELVICPLSQKCSKN